MLDFLKRGPQRLAAWWLRPAAPQAVPVGIHLLLWALLLGANLFRVGLKWLLEGAAPTWSWPLMLADLAATVATYAALFYFTWLVVVPRHLRRHKPVRFLLIVLLTVLVTSMIRFSTNIALGLMPSMWPTHVAVAPHPTSVSDSFLAGLRAGYREGYRSADKAQQPAGSDKTTGRNIVPAALLVMLLGIYLRLGNDHQHEQRRREQAERERQELEKQHLAAELSLLKAQINPHFLFNTLNNIYSLATMHDVEAPAATAVLQLSDLMRYLLYESSTDTVPLSKEVEHLRNFLSLHLLRLPGAGTEVLRFQLLSDEAQYRHYPIAPMLLLPLVENAFKHGDLTARPHAVELELGLLPEGSLAFTVRNRRRAPRPGPPQPGGVGLTNLRRRLLLLYPGRHALHVAETADTYTITLTLTPATPPVVPAPRPAAVAASA